MSKENEKTWDELARNGVLCSQPKLHMTPEEAKEYLNRNGFYEASLTGKKVLCLASGGGQQSIAFTLLGAEVTVVDFSREQLEKDRLVALEYGREINIIKADMRDLSFCEDAFFDLVYQPYSVNYIPETGQLFDEVCRVLKPGGKYDLMFHNPYVHGTWKDGCWSKAWEVTELWRGKGYPVWQPYKDGHAIETLDGNWNFENPEAEAVAIKSPQEYRHTMSTVLNGLLSRGFRIVSYQEEVGGDFSAPPGSWEHYNACLPPWIYLLSQKDG